MEDHFLGRLQDCKQAAGLQVKCHQERCSNGNIYDLSPWPRGPMDTRFDGAQKP